MPVNDFLAFATGVGANVETQSAYAADGATGVGFSTGPAISAKLNKVWRQSAFMAAVLGQFLMNELAVSVADDGDVAGKVTLLASSVNAAAHAFASGDKLLFSQAAAPTGWTQDTTVNDQVLRVVSGVGGGVGGAWAITGLTNGATGGHVLTNAELPAHAHGVTDPTHAHSQPANNSVYSSGTNSLPSNQNLSSSGGASWPTDSQPTGISIQNTGGGGSHSHAGPVITADGTWRPAYLNIISATKA